MLSKHGFGITTHGLAVRRCNVLKVPVENRLIARSARGRAHQVVVHWSVDTIHADLPQPTRERHVSDTTLYVRFRRGIIPPEVPAQWTARTGSQCPGEQAALQEHEEERRCTWAVLKCVPCTRAPTSGHSCWSSQSDASLHLWL